MAVRESVERCLKFLRARELAATYIVEKLCDRDGRHGIVRDNAMCDSLQDINTSVIIIQVR